VKLLGLLAGTTDAMADLRPWSFTASNHLLFFAGPGKIPIAPLNLYHGLRQVKMDLDQLVKDRE
jgi:hypothetical protein